MDFVAVHKVGLASRGVGEGRPAVLRTKVAPYMSHHVKSLTKFFSLNSLPSAIKEHYKDSCSSSSGIARDSL